MNKSATNQRCFEKEKPNLGGMWNTVELVNTRVTGRTEGKFCFPSSLLARAIKIEKLTCSGSDPLQEKVDELGWAMSCHISLEQLHEHIWLGIQDWKTSDADIVHLFDVICSDTPSTTGPTCIQSM